MSFSEQGSSGLRGFPLAVLGPAFVIASAVGLISIEMDSFGFAIFMFMMAFICASAIIGLAALLIGLPLTRLFESNGWERPWSYPLAGSVAGAALIIIFAAAVGPLGGPDTGELLPSELIHVLPYTLIGALPGCLSGALWWWFERRHAQQPRDAGEGSKYG